jgi:hypothetical protein
MYRWGEGVSSSWFFNNVWNKYNELVTNYKYPTLWSTNIQQFEMDTYQVCATKKLCAGFGLSALLSAYFNFQQQCIQQPLASRSQLQRQLNLLRGAGYGGANWNIKTYDANPTLTYSILGKMRDALDNIFLKNVQRRRYDYCPCQTFDKFNQFVTTQVIPPLHAGFPIGANTWLGTTDRVFVAPGTYEQWTQFAPGMNAKIAGLKKWCKKACRQ